MTAHCLSRAAPACAQTVLKDLQAAMKLARNREAASLPRRPEDDAAAAAAAAAAAQEAAERGHAREGDVERQALVQARRAPHPRPRPPMCDLLG